MPGEGGGKHLSFPLENIEMPDKSPLEPVAMNTFVASEYMQCIQWTTWMALKIICWWFIVCLTKCWNCKPPFECCRCSNFHLFIEIVAESGRSLGRVLEICRFHRGEVSRRFENRFYHILKTIWIIAGRCFDRIAIFHLYSLRWSDKQILSEMDTEWCWGHMEWQNPCHVLIKMLSFVSEICGTNANY